jgi:cystathionine beta-lyase/cystathionine gamma-synthase
MSESTDPKIFTDCAHAGEEEVESQSTPAVMPIYQTSVYNFTDLAQVDDVSDGKKPGFLYGRYGLPNQASLENIVAKLEQAESAAATASGMAAIAVAVMAMAESGDEVLVANDSYGGTLAVAARDFPRFGMTSRLIPTTNLKKVETFFSSKTKVLIVETLSNPLWNVMDVGAVSELCRRNGVKLVVDNSVATPYLIRPLAMGADVVMHSATKFLGGHHDVVAGVLTGDTEFIARSRDIAIRMGMTLGPFDSWLTIRGIKTFALRMERICSNALTVATHLEKHARVTKVYYPALESHPQHNIVLRTMRGLGGGMVSFELKGDAQTAANFVRNLKLIRFAPSFGGVTTTISHPAKTSHRSLTPAQRAEVGVSDNLLRLSIGIEETDDLIGELERVLGAI